MLTGPNKPINLRLKNGNLSKPLKAFSTNTSDATEVVGWCWIYRNKALKWVATSYGRL